MYIGNGCEEGCRVCTTPTDCTNCDAGWNMESGTDNCLTECPINFYSNNTDILAPICSSCNDKCIQCTGPNINNC